MMDNQIQDFIKELRAMKYSDSSDFREMCKEYALRENVTLERAIEIFKPICDSRERAA